MHKVMNASEYLELKALIFFCGADSNCGLLGSAYANTLWIQ